MSFQSSYCTKIIYIQPSNFSLSFPVLEILNFLLATNMNELDLNPFEAIKIAALNVGMATEADITTKSAEAIVVHINKTRVGTELPPLDYEKGKGADARAVLMDEIRNNKLDGNHPIFFNWRTATGGLKTCFKSTNLLTKTGMSRACYTELVTPTINPPPSQESPDSNAEEPIDEPNEIPNFSFHTQEPTQNSNNTEMVIFNTQTPSNNSSQPSFRSTQPSGRPSSTKSTRKSISSPRIKRREIKDKENKSTLSPADLAAMSAVFNQNNSPLINDFNEKLINTRYELSREIDTKASENYVRKQISNVNNELNSIKESVKSNLSSAHSNQSNQSKKLITIESVKIVENSDAIKTIMAKLDDYETYINKLNDKVFPAITNELISTKIDAYNLHKCNFLDAIMENKRSGFLHIKLPPGMYDAPNNRTFVIHHENIEKCHLY